MSSRSVEQKIDEQKRGYGEVFRSFAENVDEFVPEMRALAEGPVRDLIDVRLGGEEQVEVLEQVENEYRYWESRIEGSPKAFYHFPSEQDEEKIRSVLDGEKFNAVAGVSVSGIPHSVLARDFLEHPDFEMMEVEDYDRRSRSPTRDVRHSSLEDENYERMLVVDDFINSGRSVSGSAQHAEKYAEEVYILVMGNTYVQDDRLIEWQGSEPEGIEDYSRMYLDGRDIFYDTGSETINLTAGQY